jgi:hypothetical protein
MIGHSRTKQDSETCKEQQDTPGTTEQSRTRQDWAGHDGIQEDMAGQNRTHEDMEGHNKTEQKKYIFKIATIYFS